MNPNIPTPHITAKEGDFAPTVLMPGDPLRSKLLADTFLTDAVLVNNVRGVQGYTGYYQGKRVSVMASGMGMPAIGIYSHELFNFYGVENIIRIGSAGSLRADLKPRDLVFAMSAATNAVSVRLPGSNTVVAPTCSFPLMRRAVEAAERFGLRFQCGSVFSSDLFYDESGDSATLQKYGVLAVEMEAAALYLNAAKAGKNALCICTISDSLVTGESLPAEERQNSFLDMMKVALEIA